MTTNSQLNYVSTLSCKIIMIVYPVKKWRSNDRIEVADSIRVMPLIISTQYGSSMLKQPGKSPTIHTKMLVHDTLHIAHCNV